MTGVNHPARRRMRRKVLMLAILVTALVLAILFLTCGRGFGLGGKGEGDGEVKEPAPVVTVVDAGPARCAIRVTAAGITVDGAPATRDAAVTRCKPTTGADVVVTGDARQGDWDELRSALEAANIAVYLKSSRPP